MYVIFLADQFNIGCLIVFILCMHNALLLYDFLQITGIVFAGYWCCIVFAGYWYCIVFANYLYLIVFAGYWYCIVSAVFLEAFCLVVYILRCDWDQEVEKVKQLKASRPYTTQCNHVAISIVY